MYCIGAGSDAVAATTMVYSMAPKSVSVFTTWATWIVLANRDIDANHVAALLVDDGVERDGGLAGLAVADDQLALAAADRDHGVNGLDAGLHRFLHRLARHHAGRQALHRVELRGLDGALSSIGWPSASTTRPIRASPTGTDMMRRVRRTSSPSLISV